MFIGHFAVGFAAKRFAPRTSLGWLILAAIFADALWPILVLLGIERVRIDPGHSAVTPLDFVSYPWSHSLLLLVFWGALYGGAYFVGTADRRAAWVLVLCVVSHWVLDAASHVADMPLAPGRGPKVGLGLWRSVPATIAVEGAMLAAGLFLYVRATRARNRVGRLSFRTFVAFLLLSWVWNLLAPPPPSVTALATTGLVATLVVVPWVRWFDRNRDAT